MATVLLYMSCPRCQREGRYCPPEYWTHGNDCGGRLYLDERANINCERCGSRVPLVKAKLSCNSGRHWFAVSSSAEYASVISASGMVNDEAMLKWFQSVLVSLN